MCSSVAPGFLGQQGEESAQELCVLHELLHKRLIESPMLHPFSRGERT